MRWTKMAANSAMEVPFLCILPNSVRSFFPTLFTALRYLLSAVFGQHRAPPTKPYARARAECSVELGNAVRAGTRVGYRVGQGFHFQCFRNSAGEAYWSQYTYFSNLVVAVNNVGGKRSHPIFDKVTRCLVYWRGNLGMFLAILAATSAIPKSAVT